MPRICQILVIAVFLTCISEQSAIPQGRPPRPEPEWVESVYAYGGVCVSQKFQSCADWCGPNTSERLFNFCCDDYGQAKYDFKCIDSDCTEKTTPTIRQICLKKQQQQSDFDFVEPDPVVDTTWW